MSSGTILILGAGIYQAPLIRRARARGLKTLVVSRTGDYPGFRLADQVEIADTTDRERVLQIAESHSVVGIVTAGTDVAIPTLGYICDRLNLAGISYPAALRCSDKLETKRAFIERGVCTPKAVACRSLAEAISAATEIQFPLLVKSPDSSGGRGITIVHSAADLPSACELAFRNTRSGRILVEQLIQGVEFGAQAVFVRGKLEHLFIHNDRVSPPPHQTPIGHSFPSALTAQLPDDLSHKIETALAALGLETTIANLDLILSPDGHVYILEVGARIGATSLPELIHYSYGVDLYDCCLSMALGETPRMSPLAQPRPCANRLLMATASGRLKSIQVPDSVRCHEDLIDLEIDLNAGDPVERFVHGPHRLGSILCKGQTAAEAEEKALQAAQSIRFEIEEQS